MSGYSEPVARGLRYAFEGERVHSERSRFQQIDVYDHAAFGRVLVLDGLTQTTERDEFIYHEMLVHVPLLQHPAPRRVLVIGGGDGGTLRRVLEHPSVERAVMVEIDDRVTDLCRTLMPSIAGHALDDPRADVRFEDGVAFVRETRARFDAILIDSSDPVGPGEALFVQEFYRTVAARLEPGGLLATQSGSPYFQQDELHRTYANVSSVFPDARVYLANIPTYPGVLWSFVLAGERVGVDGRAAAARAAERGLRTRYWSPALHEGAFGLPLTVRDVIDPEGPPHTWGFSPEEEHVRRAVPRG